jgi:hypothetical protein
MKQSASDWFRIQNRHTLDSERGNTLVDGVQGIFCDMSAAVAIHGKYASSCCKRSIPICTSFPLCDVSKHAYSHYDAIE